ncbi:MAG: thioredoxin family protein [Bacteroidetes bacterium]|nr:thioredoxin family protein [Bacteroidota bacterium]
MQLRLLVFVTFLFCAGAIHAQEQKVQLYDPAADAATDLDAAIAGASASGKHVLVQVGGNWCPWCIKLDRLMNSNPAIDSLLKTDYVLLRVNYSKENMNPDVLARLGNPERFGFPVLVVLDGTGQRLHTQDSGLLEKNEAHDPEAVYRFLYLWRPGALHSAGK